MSKPIVQCQMHTYPEYLAVGSIAFLTPFNHPNHMPGHEVSNGDQPVRTSTIVAVDLENRRIETRNTIYQWEAA